MPAETLLNQRYELVAQQGSGGMSVIYKALDRRLGRMVAIKILRPSLTKDPAFLDKFRQEARSVAMMSHPNIVTVHDVGSDGSTHYIVMEMIDGQDLKKIIKTGGALPHEKALDYAIQICAGLGFAHRSKLVHADVKPQNILINRDGIVKVTDFGIAQAYTDTMPQTRAEVVWGSPHYFAPEQARGEKPSPASDVYSIGIVMFEMFTGRLPYGGASQRELALAHIQADIPNVLDANPQAPKEISRVIAKVMSKGPNNRYKHADQLGHILRRVREGRGISSQNAVQRPMRPPAEARPEVPLAPAAPAPSAVSVRPPRRARQPVNAPPAASRYPPQGSHPIPNLPNPVFNPDGSVNIEAADGYTGPLAPKRQTRNEGLDFVTIILVGLAFAAVAGLVPLYLFGVFPALT